MGTAITPDQLKLLSGHAEEVVLAMDADRAGEDAMIRAQRVAGARRMRLRVAAMPEGEDPAELVTDGGAERMGEVVEAAVDLPAFQVRAALDRADLGTPAGRDRALDEVAPVLGAMDADSVSRQELVRTVADRLDTDAGLVTRRVGREGRTPGVGRGGPLGAEAGGPPGGGAAGARAAGAGPDRDVHGRAGGGEGVPGAPHAGARTVPGDREGGGVDAGAPG